MSTDRIAGRHEEQQLLAAALDRAAAGAPHAFLIHGEAGVGKTRLVQHACEQARARGSAILWGCCVRFDAIEAPYHPLLKALNAWATDAAPADRAQVLGGAVDVEEYAVRAKEGHPTESAPLLAAIDRVVSAISTQNPTVLVVDDLQWADLASRDTLAFLIAGFHRQRLTVLATYRDEALVPSETFHGWLADIRRLPAVTELTLDRLDTEGTEEQLRLLFGATPHPALVEDVIRRSSGNPYFTELLVEGMTADDERLPRRVPDALSDALLAAWHQLSEPARGVLGVLSVAGTPSTSTDLTVVAAARALDRSVCSAALREATDRGLVVSVGQDLFWFRHPLLAEVVYNTFPVTELEPMHAAWARRLKLRAGASGVDEVRRQGDLARHLDKSDDFRKSLQASLRAAELAEELKAVREVALHLQRAARLWPRVHDDDEDRLSEVRLLERAAMASRRVGDGLPAVTALRRALDLVDERSDPLTSGRLRRRWTQAAWELGTPGEGARAEMVGAVELTRSAPDSPDHALALASLAHNEVWVPALSQQAKQHAEEAIAAARRSRSPLALSRAFSARAFAHMFFGQHADEDSRSSLRYALDAQDPEQICWSYICRADFFEMRGRLTEVASLLGEGFDYARDSGELSLTAYLAGGLAQSLLAMGRLHEAGAVIREGLARTAISNSAAHVRLAAARLAIRRGELEAASLHLDRARELIPSIEIRPELWAPPTLAEFELAHGRPHQALDMLRESLAVQAVDPRVADVMLMWAARAAADLAVHSRDLQDAAAASQAAADLTSLVARRRGLPGLQPFKVLTPEDLVQPAVEAVFTAERHRVEAVAGTSSVWEETVRRCETAGMVWQAELSRLRWTQALAVEGAPRSAVAAQVKAGHRFCVDAGAVPLQREFEALAQDCGITLEAPLAAEAAAANPKFAMLTAREREVLAQLVAGRTYREVAAALFISEKTVSTHVSNVLRKTGTSSRREVTALARRLEPDANAR